MFVTLLKNGQLQKREWLMHSDSKGCFYCVLWKLFHTNKNDTENRFMHGFNDCKNNYRLLQHEKSSEHRVNMQSYVMRGIVLGKIDSDLHQKNLIEVTYWDKVLSRVVQIIKYLGVLGLAF